MIQGNPLAAAALDSRLAAVRSAEATLLEHRLMRRALARLHEHPTILVAEEATRVLALVLGFKGETQLDDLDLAAHSFAIEPIDVELPRLVDYPNPTDPATMAKETP